MARSASASSFLMLCMKSRHGLPVVQHNMLIVHTILALLMLLLSLTVNITIKTAVNTTNRHHYCWLSAASKLIVYTSLYNINPAIKAVTVMKNSWICTLLLLLLLLYKNTV